MTMGRTHTKLAALLLAAALVAGCGKKAKEEKKTQPAVPVALATVSVGSMVESVPVTGTLRALNEAALRPQISARVTNVAVREGDAVTQGQVVVTLDQTDFLNQVRQAQAALDTAQAAQGAARAQWQAATRRLQVLQAGARNEERAMARSRLEQAESALKQADANLARRKKLFAAGAISREDLDASQTADDAARTTRDSVQQSLELTLSGPRPEEIQASQSEVAAARKQIESAQASVQQAKAGLSRAQEVLGYTVVRAPLSGVVWERKIEPGEIASPSGDPMLRVADLSSVYLEATVSGRLASQVQAGQSVHLTFRGEGSSRYEGTVLKLVPVADPLSRDFIARITIPKLANLTRPGLYAEGQIVVKQRQSVPIVPKEGVVERNGRSAVFVIEGDAAKERRVEVGVTDAARAEILSGLRAGERVVVSGAQNLQDGAKVTVQQGEGQ
jgi:HlyD family secretion protein